MGFFIKRYTTLFEWEMVLPILLFARQLSTLLTYSKITI